MNITNILTEAIGEDIEVPALCRNVPSQIAYEKALSLNQAKAELRAKIPAIKEAIVEVVVKIIDKECNSLDYGMEEACGTLQNLKEILTK
jgi:hypothetical protein